MFRRTLCVFTALLLIFTFGCSASKGSKNGASRAPEYAEDGALPAAPPLDSGGKDIDSDSGSKIIRTYDIYLIAEDTKELSRSIQEKLKSLGGYIQNDETYDTGMRAVIRIPSDKADSFIDYLDKNYEIKTKSSRVDDITQSYTDNEARLKNLRAQEAQILEVLKKAKTVEEILKVQNEVYRVRGEIELLEMNKKNWDRLIEYATINLTAERKILVREDEIRIISVKDFFNAVGRGITNSGKALVYGIQRLFIFLLGNILWLALISLAGVIGYRQYRKILKNKSK